MSSNEDKIQARKAMKLFQDRGYSVHDWTTSIDGFETKDKAEKDFDILVNSDFVVVINAGRVTPGKYIEIGACKVLDKKVIFIGEPRGLLSHFGIVVPAIEKALAWINTR